MSLVSATIVYADGGCSPNPGPGGWAWITTDGEQYKLGGTRYATNNEMELKAIYQALLEFPGPLIILTDSQYALDAINGQIGLNENIDLVAEIRYLLVERKLAETLTKLAKIPREENAADALVEIARKPYLPKPAARTSSFNVDDMFRL